LGRAPKIAYHTKITVFFPFDPRGTGKSTFLDGFLRDEERVTFDLLDPELADELISYPNNLLSRLAPYEGLREWVVIDEVQKAPQLLDIVHKLIKEKRFKFALTGSSARKLKRGAANLLAGRALVYSMFPLTCEELGKDAQLMDILQFGSLPEIFSLESPIAKAKFLKSYALTYLKEEIISEQIVRNLPPFRRFLDVAAQGDTEVINYSNIAKDIHSDPKTVSGYYDILEDTLLGFRLPAYSKSIRRKQKKAPKFYLFDTGVARALAERVDYELVPKTFEYGQLFESFIVNEIKRRLTYLDRQFSLSYMRVSDDTEIDLIIEQSSKARWIIEIKSTTSVDERHARALATLREDFKDAKALVISNDPAPKNFSGIDALHWTQAIEQIVQAF
jgi:predicted AAA+ superfamily ATPase